MSFPIPAKMRFPRALASASLLLLLPLAACSEDAPSESSEDVEDSDGSESDDLDVDGTRDTEDAAEAEDTDEDTDERSPREDTDERGSDDVDSDAEDEDEPELNVPAEPLEVLGQTRAARLTHTQYDNTVSDLLYLDVAPSEEFPPDPLFGGYDNNQNQLHVADRLGRDYRRAAETLAELAVNDPGAFSQLAPCSDATSECRDDFVERFGARAYRRPLSSDERDLYVALFDQGQELVGSGDAFRDGAQLVLEAMLQSPKFLYRVELSGSDEDTAVALSDHELAQRLSYTLWNTMPDDTMFELAAEGRLSESEVLEALVGEMLDDVRARGPSRDFHYQWLKMSRYQDLRRDDSFEDFHSELPLAEESLRFIEYVGFDLERGYESLLTAPFTFVNRDLARLYGIDGDFGDGFSRVDLDPQERGGLLTQIGFLASNAYASETSPIHRGVFINRTLLCNTIPDPPSDLNLEEFVPENPRTTRDAVEQQTSPAACVGCHSLINPPGFAFEGFDAVGQVRDSDRGNPVDTTGELLLDGELVSFEGALDLVQAIGQSEQARECFARNLVRYHRGRDETEQDESLIRALAGATSSDDFGVKAALAVLVLSPDFATRAPNED